MSKKILQAAAGAGGESVYVEDVFSTYLYDGNNSTNQIQNDIDLSGEGGMVWLKVRNTVGDNNIYDTERGIRKYLTSNSTAAESYIDSSGYGLTAFNNNGFTLEASWNNENANSNNYVSWSFRKQAGFFDVVTYTGDGTSAREIAHNLGCKPAIIIVKNLDQSYDWAVWHKSFDVNEYDSAHVHLNTTDASTYTGTPFPSQLNVGSRDPSANFYVHNNSMTNTNGVDYVAYLFADGDDTNAQIFGDNSDESIIKCGGGTYDSNGYADVDLGFEPQWVLIKPATFAADWRIYDVMRGMTTASGSSIPITSTTPNAFLEPNTSDAEATTSYGIMPTTTGFLDVNGSSGQDYIYIAIRRPMKTPESGTEVFASSYNQEVSSATSGFYSGFPVDLAIKRIITASQPNYLFDRLRGAKSLRTNLTNAEGGFSAAEFDHQEGFYYDADSANTNDISWMFKRATGFLDVVAYKGSNSVYLKDHNLGVVPEMMIVKNRDAAETGWSVYHSALGADYRVQLNSTSASSAASDWDNASDVGTAPTATQFNVKAASVIVNNATSNYVAYLFATLAGVSKVGSYTGNGSSQNIDCGFSSGARFVLIKRTDSSSNWYLFDSIEQGIVAGNDPHIALNTTDAQYTSDDLVDPYSTSYVNTSSAEYIFLAIA
jgi:hypothetical protein